MTTPQKSGADFEKTLEWAEKLFNEYTGFNMTAAKAQLPFIRQSLTMAMQRQGAVDDVSTARNGFAFMMSCVKSGEEWSSTCDQIRADTLQALSRIAANYTITAKE